MNAAAKSPFTESELAPLRSAQRAWREVPVRRRLRVIQGLRREIAAAAMDLAATVPSKLPGALHRNLAETLTAEVLPLADACRWLQNEAELLLTPRIEGTNSRPVWLGRTEIETRRVPFGIVLIVAPSNYPLFLPGVQALQALVAGNAVLWKPAPGTSAPANSLRAMLISNGLDADLIRVLPEEPAVAQQAIRAGVDKVVLTGSVETGKTVLHMLADTVTPSVMELSGCDSAFVLEGADVDRVADAITFGIRLNGSCTCMATRRIFAASSVMPRLIRALQLRLSHVDAVELPLKTHALLSDLVTEATLYGAQLVVNGLKPPIRAASEFACGPVLLTDVTTAMRVTCTDIFAPVASLISFDHPSAAARMHAECPYLLTAAIFGPEKQATALARQLHCGTIVINDVIISTADPRVSFGGLHCSGFGSTRGPQGLLEMTAVQTWIRNRSHSKVPYKAVGDSYAPLFAAWIAMCHGGWRGMGGSLKSLLRAGRKLQR